MPATYFCVDAGATRCRGRLYDQGGIMLAAAEAGPANAAYDLEQALTSIRELWRALCGAAAHDAADVAGASFAVGGAGLYVPVVREAFTERCPAFGAVLTMSDGYAALLGAGGGEPAALLTVGTGVAGHRLFADGSSIQRDALGWVLGDRGGGCWMGTRALRHAMAVLDGVAAPSALSRSVLARIGGTEGLLGGFLSGLDASRLAGFAPLVLDKAREGCPVAAGILDRAVDHLAALIGALDCRDVPLFLNGGLAGVLRPLLAARIGRAFDEPAGDALHGCLLAARGQAPPERTVFA